MINALLHMDRQEIAEQLKIWRIRRRSFSGRAREQFYGRIGQLLADGYPLGFILKRMREAAEHRGDHKSAAVYEQLGGRIDEGMTLTAALEDLIPTADRVILAAAESGDNLGPGLLNLAELNYQLNSMISALKKALIMPAATVAILVAVVVFVSQKIMVEFSVTVPSHLWPSVSRSLRDFGDSLVSNWWIWAAFVAAFVFFVRWTLPNLTAPAVRRWLDYLPPYAPYRRFQAFSFMVSLNAMVRAGIPIRTSIRTIAEHSDPFLERYLMDVDDRLGEGMPDGQALSSSLFDDDTKDDLYIMGESNNIGGVLGNISRNIITRMQAYMDGLNIVVNLSVMVSVATVIAWVILAIQGLSSAIEMMAQ